MLILISSLFLLFTVSTANPPVLNLTGTESFRFLVPSQSLFQLTIRASQFPHLLVQLDSCRLGFMKLLNVSASQNIPPAFLYEFTYVYNITKDLTKLIIDYTTTNLNSYVIVYGFSDFSKLPNNPMQISTAWTDQQLKISFSPVSIYSTVIQCNYTIQFYANQSDYNCRFNDSEHMIGQITLPSQISNNLTNLIIDVPLNNQYMTKRSSNYNFTRLSSIQDLINSGQNFEIQVYAQISKPVLFDMHYTRTKVEPPTALEALRNGFVIIIVGVLVYGLISCVYLFCKRKYKNPNYFHEETEHHHESPQTPATGTVDELKNQH